MIPVLDSKKKRGNNLQEEMARFDNDEERWRNFFIVCLIFKSTGATVGKAMKAISSRTALSSLESSDQQERPWVRL